MNPIARYFSWLQRGNFAGRIDRFPVLDQQGRTSVEGLYVIGDLTGIPLLKLAAESGKRFIETLQTDRRFAELRRDDRQETDLLDLVIVGAGPSGVSAAMEARRHGYRFLIIESSTPFTTVADYPSGKPIFPEPEHVPSTSLLQTPAGTKESLLESLESQLASADLPIRTGETVDLVRRVGEHFIITTRTDRGERTYRALRVALAVGRNGSARTLGIPGEELGKVYNRLIDPKHYRKERIVVVGGGNSALETAIALAETGNRVTLCHRGKSFSRPDRNNLRRLEELAREGRLETALETTLVAITRLHVTLQTPDGTAEIGNDAVFVMIGRRLPEDLLARCGVEMRDAWSFRRLAALLLGLLFAAVLYFGKKATAWDFPSETGAGELSLWSGIIRTAGHMLTIPLRALDRFGDAAHFGWYGWRELLIDLSAWISTALLLVTAAVLGMLAWRRLRSSRPAPWQIFKMLYFTIAAALFLVVFVGDKYAGTRLAGMDSSTWYSLLYSLTIVIFGFRRISRTPTRYVKLQTYTLMAVQVIPLFILPVMVLPWLWQSGHLSADSWLIRNAFPVAAWNNQPEFWRAYGLVLAWPLFLYNLFTDQPTTFWLITSFVQTFVIIPLIVWRWGKGAYCGWICSCGGLAETLGDEYRSMAPHGPAAKRWENAGQWVLLFVGLLTVAKLVSVFTGTELFLPTLLQGERIYSIAIDILFAGVLGLGVYFALSGRVWCRFLCPLAALMHIYARFTRYRIFARKERCISCNACTTACHMGIDVMGYANKGIPMNDVECVRCSACITACPMDVLSFGELPSADPDNRLYLELPVVGRPESDWRSGMRPPVIDRSGSAPHAAGR